jgi:hypothetical protein
MDRPLSGDHGPDNVTGFGFPFGTFLASHGVGIVSLLILPVVIAARYWKQLTGAWRLVYVVGAVLVLYLNVFVLLVQLFRRVPALLVSAPTQREPSFLVTQLLVLALFVGLGVAAAKGFHPAAVVRPRGDAALAGGAQAGFLLVITVFNILLLVFSLSRTRPVEAKNMAPVLRGQALEIADGRGRVRASITIQPADPAFKMPDGTIGYPETVLLRLIDSKGGPNVKLGATERGAGLLLGGESDPTYVQILAKGPGTSLKLSDKDGREKVITPQAADD